MNKVILLGNLTRDPQLRTTGNGTPVASFGLACSRRFKDQNGERQADFIDCVAWRQHADFVSKYLHKGSRILVEGSLRSRNYEDNQGNRRYVTEVVVDNVEFAGGKDNNGGGRAAYGGSQGASYNTYGGSPAPAPDPYAAPAAGAPDTYVGSPGAPSNTYGGTRAPVPAAAHPAQEVFEDDVDMEFEPLDDSELPF